MFVRRIVAMLLYLIVLSVLLVSSCVGPVALYQQSAWWGLSDVTAESHSRYFIALERVGEDGNKELDIVTYAKVFKYNEYPDANYHLAAGKHSYQWDGGGSATIQVETEGVNQSHVYVRVSGDTPWTSISEYRVANNQVYPLKHSLANGWFLLLPLLFFALVAYASTALKHKIYISMKVREDNEKTGSVSKSF